MQKFEDNLRILCKASTTSVFSCLKRRGFTVTKDRYAYKPGATPDAPLIVCHADTVENGGESGHKYSYKNGIANSIALDDRLGITSMLWLLDGSMADCAALVCDDEEIGRSTAQFFLEDIKPNWLVELDRRGTDVVCYKYESTLLTSLLEWAGFEVGCGTYSDICYLDHYEVCGFNVGVGYHQEHSPACHANLTDTFAQLNRLQAFYKKFRDVRFAYKPRKWANYGKSSYSWPANDWYDDVDARFEDSMLDDDEDLAILAWLEDTDFDSYEAIGGDTTQARECWTAAGRPSLTRYY